MTIRVLIADDQALIRHSMRLILDDQDDLEVVAEAADGVEAVEAARRLRPDVSLVDIRMPRRDGLDVTRALAGPGVIDPLKVVVVTTFDQDDYVYGALRGGAAGFILKDAGAPLLVEAVRAAHAGDALISPALTVRLLRDLSTADPARRTGTDPARRTDPARGTGTDSDRRTDRARRTGTGTAGRAATGPALHTPLSDREQEVARCLARGRTNREIAADLFISLSTVKGHLAAIQSKLGARNRVEIVAWAWSTGLSRRR